MFLLYVGVARAHIYIPVLVGLRCIQGKAIQIPDVSIEVVVGSTRLIARELSDHVLSKAIIWYS